FRTRSANAQSIAGFVVRTPVMSIPSYMGGFRATKSVAFTSWPEAALPQIFWAGAQIRFAVTPGRVVDGKRDHTDAGSLNSLQDFLARFPTARRVHLIPHRPPQCRVPIFHRG